ncbi:MAG: SLBB domain-containing protein [Proteobacteria bacterium]|nr:SLBB domain-containing protein [Pseudomonadota bacterium]
MKIYLRFWILISLFLNLEINSQQVIQNISPQQIDAMKRLSPSELEELLEQTGIDLPNSKFNSFESLQEDRNETNPSQEDTLNTEKDLISKGEDQDNNLLNAPITPIKTFGHSVFNNRISTFAPVDNLPVPDDYILGPGDQLIIQFIGTENFQIAPTLSREGSIFIDKIGEIVLAGMTYSQSVDFIKKRISSELIGVQSIISMGKIKSINVFISGEVSNPGMYSLSSLTTITQSLYQAGGPTDIGSLRNIQVIRNGNIVNQFDAYDLLIYGNSQNDIRLRSGDVLFIPTIQGTATISGAVKRSYEFEILEKDTIGDLLEWAGGFSSNANPMFAYLLSNKEIGGLPSSKTLDLSQTSNLQILLHNNDQINIPVTGDALLNSIYISGEVNRPGPFGWYAGIKLSDIFNDYLYDFNDKADPFFAYIERLHLETFQYEILSFNPVDIFLRSDPDSDLLLKENDNIVILSKEVESRKSQIDATVSLLNLQRTEEYPLQTVTITGGVKYPNTYPIFSNNNLDTVIQAAGGLDDAAFRNAIEISRKSSTDDNLIKSEVSEISFINAQAFTLQSRDRIFVRTKIDLTSQEFVTITGRVQFPGTYPYSEKDRITDLITRAGGLREDAFIKGAILVRESVKRQQDINNKSLVNRLKSNYSSALLTNEGNANNLNDISVITNILEELNSDGRVAFNLEDALHNDLESNLFLEPGDVLNIPYNISTIAIIGEVNAPNTLTFNPSLKVQDYLTLAGGLTKRANKDEIYILKANGMIEPLKNSIFGIGLSRPQLSAGDTIVVPVNITYTDNLSLWRNVTQVIYQSMVSLAAIDRIAQ